MANLIDMIAAIDNSVTRVPVHPFMAAIGLYAEGILTPAEAVQDFPQIAAEPDALTQAQAILTAIDNEANSLNKIRLARRITDVMLLTEFNSVHFITGDVIDYLAVKEAAGF